MKWSVSKANAKLRREGNIGADYIISGNVLKQGSELKLVLKFHDAAQPKRCIEQVTSGASRGLIKRTPNQTKT